jgi:hypothetical protein
MAPRKQSSKSSLSKFDGQDVLVSRIKVAKAGDGLSKALEVEPTEFHHGDRVFVVLETVVGQVEFPELKDGVGLARVHRLDTELATIVDSQLVAKLLEEQRKKIAEHEGTPEIDFDSPSE